MPVYDLHSHILPKVDDGSRDMKMTAAMLELELKQGVTHVVATPHFNGWKYSFERFLERREKGVEKVRKYYDKRPEVAHPELYLGAEVGYFKGLSNAPFLDQLAVQGTNTLLIEMPWWDAWQDEFVDEVLDIHNNLGFTVYLAHIERYLEDRANIPRLEKMREAGMHAHMNASSLLKWPANAKLLKHYKTGLADLLATDAHNLEKRPPNIDLGRKAISRKCGAAKLDEIDTIGGLLLQDAVSII